MPDLKDRAMQVAAHRASITLSLAEANGVTPKDAFIAMLAMVAAQNPRLARKTLDALEASLVRGAVQGSTKASNG